MCLLVPSGAVAQSPIDRWNAIREIDGAFDVTVDDPPISGGLFSGRGHRRASGRFHLTRNNGDPRAPSWSGTWKGTLEVDVEVRHAQAGLMKTEKGGGQVSGEIGFGIYPTSKTSNEFLYSFSEEGGEGTCTFFEMNQGAHTDSCSTRPSITVSGQPLPSGQTITGSGTPLSAKNGHFNFTIGAGRREEIEAVIITDKRYDDWVPTAGPDEDAPGSWFGVRVELRKKDHPKETPGRTAKRFKFELVNVSHQPGVCINAPSTNAKTDFDLKIVGDKDVTVESDGQTAHSKEHVAQSAVTIVSHDWGAYGKLQITAEMEDGPPVLAHLESHPTFNSLTIPRDDNGNHIADVWEQKLKGAAASTADDENDPVGDGKKGDGLTLYEEYRGFLQNGHHEQGDPNKKDYFVINRVADQEKAAGGITLFEKASGLVVHRLTKDELKDRVVNFNHDGDAHLVDQHGVIIVDAAPRSEEARAERVDGNQDAPSGTPKDYTQISLPTDRAQTPQSYLDATLAHEMLHTCKVSHHGTGDYAVSWKREVRNGKEVIVETVYLKSGGVHSVSVVDVRTENTVPVRPSRYQNKQDLVVGVKGGESSGDVECVMRYDDRTVYASEQYPARRYVARDKRPTYGSGICKSPVGTGFNEATHDPESRFGSAQKACADQIRVNDSSAH